MRQITLFFWHLCLLRENPANLPSSPFATAIVFCIYFLIGIASAALSRPQDSLYIYLGTFAVSIFVQISITLLLLEFKGVRSRFLRTWTALLGASSIVALFMMLLTTLFINIENELVRQFADSAIWVCLGWWLAIAGYIYHKAINISVLQGSVIAFAIEFMSLVLAITLFPR